MDIAIEQNAGLLKIGIAGRLIASEVDGLKARIEGLIEACPNVLFDLSQMTHIDSSGLGVIVRIFQRCKGFGGTCRLAALQPHPRIVIEITKLHRVLDVCETVAEAEDAFARDPKTTCA